MSSNHVEVEREIIIENPSMMFMQRVMKIPSLLTAPECIQKIYSDRECIQEYDKAMSTSCTHNVNSWE